MKYGNCSLHVIASRVLRLAMMTLLIYFFGLSDVHAQSREYIVYSIKGTVESIALGEILREGDQIELPSEVEIRLLSKLGEKLLLKGPISAVITNEGNNEEGETALETLSELLFADEKFIPVLAGTRTIGKQTDISTLFLNDPSIDPWSPVLSQYNDYCLLRDHPILWRHKNETELTLLLNTENVTKSEIKWPAKSRALHFNEHLDSLQVDITASISGRSNPVNIHFLDAQVTTLVRHISSLVERNCLYQAMQLLAIER